MQAFGCSGRERHQEQLMTSRSARRVRLTVTLLTAALWLGAGATSTWAQGQKADPPPVLDLAALSCGQGVERPGESQSLCELKKDMGITLTASVETWTKSGRSVDDLLLVINGLPFDHVRAVAPKRDSNFISVYLDPQADRDQWKRLFAGQDRTATFHVALAVREPGNIASTTTVLTLVSNARTARFLVRPDYIVWVYVFLGLFLVAVLVLGYWTDLLRDPGADAASARRPFSLARTQLAFWTVIIVTGYLFIWVILGNPNPLNQTALVLMGVSAVTGLLATSVDANAIKAHGQPTRGFVQDILSDASGVSIYRLQMVAWTLALGFVFAYGIWDDLAMPTFEPVQLGLLGLSNGTYVGLKLSAAVK